MSHPVPGHTYGENEYESHSPHKEGGVRPHKKNLGSRMSDITKSARKLDAMVREPATKAWFAKYGVPKVLNDKKGVELAKTKALNKKTGKASEMHKRAKHFA